MLQVVLLLGLPSLPLVLLPVLHVRLELGRSGAQLGCHSALTQGWVKGGEGCKSMCAYVLVIDRGAGKQVGRH